LEHGNHNSDVMDRLYGVYVRKITTVERNILLINLRSYDVVFFKYNNLFYNVNILENIDNIVVVYYGYRESIKDVSNMSRRGG
tara:strand:+ start:931 stop:1179 length:249 start_codon:yes stop_codon:yes gene_type:complete